MTPEEGDGGGGKDLYGRQRGKGSDDEGGRKKGDKDKLERPTNGERVSQRSWPR